MGQYIQLRRKKGFFVCFSILISTGFASSIFTEKNELKFDLWIAFQES